jgi:plasmid stabilization system protein ParE
VVSLIILDEAQKELTDAITHYEGIEPMLGRKLRDEVGSNLAWIQAHPKMPRLRPQGYYRVNLRTFPYYIPYIIRNNTLCVLALAHVRRRPLYWIKRRIAG